MTKDAPAEFDFGAWLDAGAISTITVPINSNFDRSLLDEQEAVKKRIVEVDAQIEAKREDTDGSLADDDDTSELEDERESLYKQFEELYLRHKATELLVTVRALAPDEKSRIVDAHVVPSPPKTLPVGAAREQRRKYDRELAKWRSEASAIETERNLAFISRAVVSVERAGEVVAESMSVDALRTIHQRPNGPTMTGKLLTAVDTATTGEVTIDAPKSPEPSTSATQ